MVFRDDAETRRVVTRTLDSKDGSVALKKKKKLVANHFNDECTKPRGTQRATCENTQTRVSALMKCPWAQDKRMPDTRMKEEKLKCRQISFCEIKKLFFFFWSINIVLMHHSSALEG